MEWEEISPNRVRLGALQIFLLFPQILYELGEKKIKKNYISIQRDARAADTVSTHVHRMHSVYPIL